MVKVALVLAFSIVSAMSIRAICTDTPPYPGGTGDNMAKSPTQKTMERARQASAPTMTRVEQATAPTVHKIEQATAPAVHSMRGAAHAIASQASNAAETAKYETDSLGSWLKAKFQGLWGTKNHAPAPAPMA